ncbi:HemY domain protein [Ketogulonicigenium robustum]|uniref:HemY domain protein n=1 Tax=Ketogulonicigenium robustum TaxID=92947 RepID=A0A1W6P2G1_9RHOB|nr:heme biosynthesis HemY N-terminal domain-containing protein [Ketogulonicigenium robustum]ARO15619.1 HemY domain protein [Ketogulonicigenium robustum]
MIWSLLKILLFVAVVTAVTFGAVWLAEMPGGALVTLGGVEFTLRPLEGVIAIAILMMAAWAVFRLLGLLLAVLRFINGDDTAVSRFFSRGRERKGMKALSDSVLALAAGEPKEALSRAKVADKYLGAPDITHVLMAHTAERAGETDLAEQTYKELLESDRTRFVALQGLMKQKLAAGDSVTALKLAEAAFKARPENVEVQDILLRLQAESSDWAGARATLGEKARRGVLPRDVYRRRDAVLALSEAQAVFDDQVPIDARERAIEANRLSPDLVPAAVMAARSYINEGNTRYATRVLRKAWEAQPHPDIAEAFAEIAPDERPDARLARFETLTNLRTDHPETKMLRAELLIATGDFPAARRALGNLVEGADATSRSLALMAAVERGMGADESVVRGWLTKALTAPRGPQWVCGQCGKVHAHWLPVCDSCHGFDTLAWVTPPASDFAMPGGAAMLPLIVGAPEAAAATEAVVEDVQPAPIDPSKTTAPAAAKPEEVYIPPPPDVVLADDTPPSRAN